ncbi:Aldo/keto reductase [Desulfosarcina cetonica]|uniref:aldo/keto reductase n=1 Tax=Desulfosarcina cetonica TaxID=90730 RepID=UPI0006D2532E|nr:aldo/keto reductase [Desulfosarcina cetonica]VTR65570.1 Aldo/keto reductase [Desulfosarcina cetonica]
MQTTVLGKTDIHLSAIIMGTWQTGKAMWTGIDDAESEKAIRAAMDNGITTFDTAEAYGNGHSEKVLGKAIGGDRDKVQILSKVFSNHLKHDQVVAACERSLKNLGTDYLDLYQIHWPSGSFGAKPVPPEETMAALAELKSQGKIRAIGVSNFSLEQLKAICQVGAIESLQPPYSLLWRHVEKESLAWCQAHQVTVLAYSPMAQGLLTGKFGPDHQFEKGDHRSANRLFQPDVYPSVQTALTALRAMAEKKGISMAQLALAWVIAKPGVCAIAGARNAAQSSANAQAAAVHLEDAELAELDRISRPVTACIDDNPVLWAW